MGDARAVVDVDAEYARVRADEVQERERRALELNSEGVERVQPPPLRRFARERVAVVFALREPRRRTARHVGVLESVRAAAHPESRIARLRQSSALAVREQEAEARGDAGADGRAPARTVVTIVAEEDLARAGRDEVDDWDQVDDGDAVMRCDLRARDRAA